MFDFYRNRRIFLTVSSIIVLVTIIYAAVMGVKLDIQFSGGTILTYSYTGTVDTDKIESTVKNELKDTEISVLLGKNATIGSTITVSIPLKGGISTEREEKITQNLSSAFPQNNIESVSITNVDASIGSEFLIKSVLAIVVASIFIVLYIGVRFKKIGGFTAGTMAMLALLHDVIVVFAVFVFMDIPLNDSFIAAILTILGYSLNDTIVIYDRIRENKSLKSNCSLAELVNVSINQSLGRSICTTLATALAMGVVAVVALMYGITSITTFAVPLMAGIISGAYSSICLTGPLWVMWESRGKATPKTA